MRELIDVLREEYPQFQKRLGALRLALQCESMAAHSEDITDELHASMYLNVVDAAYELVLPWRYIKALAEVRHEMRKMREVYDATSVDATFGDKIDSLVVLRDKLKVELEANIDWVGQQAEISIKNQIDEDLREFHVAEPAAT